MWYSKENLKILNQGIDTLVIGVNCIEKKVFDFKFSILKDKLKKIKESAKEINSYGEKFVKDDLELNLGSFLISSKGVGGYSYLFKNNDIFVSVSNSKFDSKKQYHLKIQFRAEFLLKFGHFKAYLFVAKFLQKLFFNPKNYKITILRIDIATDVTGIRYYPTDIFNFRSLSRIKNYSINSIDYLIEDEKNLNFPTLEETDIINFSRFNRFEGISFGKAPMMFRIYDKINEISKKGSSKLILKKWELNGFDYERDRYVFRHECEFTREYLRKLIPFKCSNEIQYVFENLSGFWDKGLQICRWYDLSDDEIESIQKGELASSSVRSIYQRSLMKKDRFNFWDYLSTWKNEELKSIPKKELPYIVDMSKPKKALKAFINSVYVNLGYKGAFTDVLREVLKDLQKEDLTLHEYGLLKLASKFADNEKGYEISEFDNESLKRVFENNIIDFCFVLDEIASIRDKAKLKEVLNLYYNK